MIIAIVAAAVAVANPGAALLDEAAHSIAAHRLQEARLLLAKAINERDSGDRLDGLLADLAFESSDYPEAEARYAQLVNKHPADERVAERAGIAALMLGDTATARSFIGKAIASSHPTWRAWNAQGVLCDLDRDWAGADQAFENAFILSPQQPEILNNHGWSLMLRGEWSRALPLLKQAAALDPASSRIADNLELARAAVAEDLPHRLPKESDSDFAARLNDAGVLAQQQGDRAKAIAAFSRALAANDTWDARAANNLHRAQAQ